MIPLKSSAIESFRPPALKERLPKAEILFSVPTLFDRDVVSSRLFALGVVPVKQSYIRACVIDELFKLHDVDEAERLAAILEAGWAEVQLYSSLLTDWRDQERERLRDEYAGAPGRPAMAMPTSNLSARERARIDIIAEDTVNASPRLRKLSAQATGYEAEQRTMIVRMHLAGWAGIDVQRSAVRDGDVELVDPDCILALRQAVGEAAWIEILDAAYALYDLNREEVGNSASPPEQPSRRAGSNGRSGGSVTRSGASTKSKAQTTKKAGSNTEPAPSAASPKTTDTSSSSSTRSATRKGSRGGRMAAAS